MVPSQYFVDSLFLSAIAPIAQHKAVGSLGYLSSRCASLGRPSLSRMRGGGAVHGLSCGEREQPPHNVRRFSLPDNYLCNREAQLPPDTAPPPTDSAPTAGPQHAVLQRCADDDGASAQQGGRSSSSFQPYTLDWALLVETAFAVYAELGDGCSERTYQKKLYYALYCLDIPCVMERPVHTTQHGMTLGKGRVDLEVARRFVLELKVTLPTEKNLRKDKRQLLRYLSTYQEQGMQMERAALVYFANDEVRVVEVSTAQRPRNRFVLRRTDTVQC